MVNLEDVARDARKGGSGLTDDGKVDGVEKGVGRVDEFLGGLREGLRERGAEGITEIVVVGDAGLTGTFELFFQSAVEMSDCVDSLGVQTRVLIELFIWIDSSAMRSTRSNIKMVSPRVKGISQSSSY